MATVVFTALVVETAMNSTSNGPGVLVTVAVTLMVVSSRER